MSGSRCLADRVVVVAGASGGMGKAIALAAAAEGATLVLAARNEEALGRVADAAAAAGAACRVVPTDATEPAAAAALVDAALAAHGRIDSLVITVGTNIPKRSIDELTPQSWAGMLDANLTAAFNLTHAAVPPMRARGAGQIIFISSSAARRPDVSGAAYQASKAGVLALAHAVAEEERANGIRISVILPGMTHTDLIYKRPTPPTLEMLARALQPEDVAAAALFVLCLPERANVPELQIYPSR